MFFITFGHSGISSRSYPHTYTHYCYQNVFALKMLCIQKQSSGAFVAKVLWFSVVNKMMMMGWSVSVE